jgi:hypothetical protein
MCDSACRIVKSNLAATIRGAARKRRTCCMLRSSCRLTSFNVVLPRSQENQRAAIHSHFTLGYFKFGLRCRFHIPSANLPKGREYVFQLMNRFKNLSRRGVSPIDMGSTCESMIRRPTRFFEISGFVRPMQSRNDTQDDFIPLSRAA